MNIFTLTVVFVPLTPSVLFSQATTNSPADWTPPGWQVVQMAREGIGASWIDGGIWTNATGRILVWKIQEDSQPLYTESAVLWLQLQTPAGNKWKLAHVFRHPKYPHATWCLHKIMDSPQRDTSTVYDRPPRADEVEAFLRETWWSFMPDSGFSLIDGAVCVQNWQAATGVPAPQALVNEPGRWRSKKGITEPNENGAANGSQPIRSETNRTSSATGSRR